MPAHSYVARPGVGFGKARSPSVKMAMIPAPARGINAVDPLATLSLDYCTNMVNMIPDGRGARVRSGYSQFVTGTGKPVRTTIPFSAQNTANSRLFGTTDAGIYDFTAGGTGPWVAEVAFGTTGGNAGWGVWCQHTTDAGTQYAFYADEVNGLYRRAEGGTWAAVADITGVTGGDSALVFCMQHKKRLWFVQRDSGNAWFLAAGAISGAATAFNFGAQFPHGGTLVGLWTWTVDGGGILDDNLVAISTSGDVVVYKFTDPTVASTFTQIAQYYIGPVPAGRRLATQSGGELFVLSQYGVLPLTKLIAGRPIQEQDVFVSRNITPLLTADLNTTLTQRGWELTPVPSENILLLSTPKQPGYPYKQYALSTKTNGWGLFNDLPFISGNTYSGTFYCGADDGLNKFTGTQDNVTLAGGTGVARAFSLLTAFSDGDNPGHVHRVQFLRPVFRAGGSLGYEIQARYDYDTADFSPSLVNPMISGALWDSGIWDVGLWGADQVTVNQPAGSAGIGYAVGAIISGSTSSETTLLRIDMAFDTGGPL